MVHGSSHTAACLESTPDGREGWYPYFVRKGISTYLVDQAGRGRSGFDESVINEAAAIIKGGDTAKGLAMVPAVARITDNGAWTNWFGHLIPPGSTILNGKLIQHGDPGDPPSDAAIHGNEYHPAYPIGAVDAKVVSREGAIGPAPSGPNNDLALEYYKQLVPNSEATLPGSICPTCDPKEIAPANTWTPQDLASLVERLGGAVVATHSQSGIMGHHMVRILKERGHLDMLKGLITIEGSCSLPKQRAHCGRFRQYPISRLEGRLHRNQSRVPNDGRRDQCQARCRPRDREGGIHQIGRTRKANLQRYDPHDDAWHKQPRRFADAGHSEAGLTEQYRQGTRPPGTRSNGWHGLSANRGCLINIGSLAWPSDFPNDMIAARAGQTAGLELRAHRR